MRSFISQIILIFILKKFFIWKIFFDSIKTLFCIQVKKKFSRLRHVCSFNVETVWKWIWATLVCYFDILNYGEREKKVLCRCHQTIYLNYFNQKSTQNKSNTSRSRREFKSHNWMVKVLLKQRKRIINANHLSIPIHFESNRIESMTLWNWQWWFDAFRIENGVMFMSYL